VIHDHDLFEAVANSPYLPEEYRIAMVVRPGAQGGSEIVGEWQQSESHIYEYLRRNSYIAGGHYAANMAEDALRYRIDELAEEDMQGLRHLYYQRSFIRLAEQLGIGHTQGNGPLYPAELEELRLKILRHVRTQPLDLATLWGWNFGFDFAPTRYRLHASHQQVHQQYAMVPGKIPRYRKGNVESDGQIASYCCGDLVARAINEYRETHGRELFVDYLAAIRSNERMDDRQGHRDLVVWEDSRVMLFVPKAQTSQWELQLMTLPNEQGLFPGTILECDTQTRISLDQAILFAQRIFWKLGAKLVTSIEFSRRIADGRATSQPLIYSFLPRLPHSPGAFSEAQLRFINGHYPEDFAAICRERLKLSRRNI
jgi:hypothetical protein